jgi:hypothetical protein
MKGENDKLNEKLEALKDGLADRDLDDDDLEEAENIADLEMEVASQPTIDGLAEIDMLKATRAKQLPPKSPGDELEFDEAELERQLAEEASRTADEELEDIEKEERAEEAAQAVAEPAKEQSNAPAVSANGQDAQKTAKTAELRDKAKDILTQMQRLNHLQQLIPAATKRVLKLVNELDAIPIKDREARSLKKTEVENAKTVRGRLMDERSALTKSLSNTDLNKQQERPNNAQPVQSPQPVENVNKQAQPVQPPKIPSQPRPVKSSVSKDKRLETGQPLFEQALQGTLPNEIGGVRNAMAYGLSQVETETNGTKRQQNLAALSLLYDKANALNQGQNKDSTLDEKLMKEVYMKINENNSQSIEDAAAVSEIASPKVDSKSRTWEGMFDAVEDGFTRSRYYKGTDGKPHDAYNFFAPLGEVRGKIGNNMSQAHDILWTNRGILGKIVGAILYLPVMVATLFVSTGVNIFAAIVEGAGNVVNAACNSIGAIANGVCKAFGMAFHGIANLLEKYVIDPLIKLGEKYPILAPLILPVASVVSVVKNTIDMAGTGLEKTGDLAQATMTSLGAVSKAVINIPPLVNHSALHAGRSIMQVGASAGHVATSMVKEFGEQANAFGDKMSDCKIPGSRAFAVGAKYTGTVVTAVGHAAEGVVDATMGGLLQGSTEGMKVGAKEVANAVVGGVIESSKGAANAAIGNNTKEHREQAGLAQEGSKKTIDLNAVYKDEEFIKASEGMKQRNASGLDKDGFDAAQQAAKEAAQAQARKSSGASIGG